MKALFVSNQKNIKSILLINILEIHVHGQGKDLKLNSCTVNLVPK